MIGKEPSPRQVEECQSCDAKSTPQTQEDDGRRDNVNSQDMFEVVGLCGMNFLVFSFPIPCSSKMHIMII